MHLTASYRDRSHLGTPDYECQHCHALFWHAERNSSNRYGIVQYYNCCKGGKLSIPSYTPRPEPLASLSKFHGDSISKRFMRSIRQYNCLFAFTSMGAHQPLLGLIAIHSIKRGLADFFYSEIGSNNILA